MRRSIISLLPLISCLVAGYFGRFLGSEGTFSIPSFLLLFLVLFFGFSLLYRFLLKKKRKNSAMILYVLLYCLLLSCSYFLRIKVLDLLHVATVLSSFYVLLLSSSSESMHSDGEAGSLPPLESESSSASLATYRNVIAAESEAEIYNRIRILENQEYFNIPPQNNIGDYERLVREHFDQALNVDHYLEIWDKEYEELQFLEKKALLQDKLQHLMLNERNIARIMELSPYTDIRKEAYLYIQSKVEPVSSLEYAFQLNIMEGSLNSFLQDLNAHDRQSGIYREFYRYFIDDEFRRTNGLPLP